MAKKIETITTLIDDIDGGKADRTILFSVDGVNYEIDLSKRNANAFEKAVRPYVAAARKAGRGSTRRRTRSAAGSKTAGRSDLSAIREWAKANGIEVSERGRISNAVIEQYDASR